MLSVERGSKGRQLMLDKAKQFARKFSEAWTACMVCMVQGDLSVISLYHAGVAAKTGTIAGLIVVLASLWPRLNNKWAIVWLTGVATAFADILFVSSHFGAWWTEAVVTGMGAMMLAILFDKVLGNGKDK